MMEKKKGMKEGKKVELKVRTTYESGEGKMRKRERGKERRYE